MPPPQLKPDQLEGIEWLRPKPRALLADEAGSGKTAQLLLAAEGKTLVVSTAMSKDVWTTERDIWRPGFEFEFVPYSSICVRDEDNRTSPDPKPYLRQNWDTLLVDEAHNLCNRQADWTRAFQKLKAERTYLATGTPIPNWAQDLWMLLRILKPYSTFLRSYWRWVTYWFDSWEPPWGGTQILDLKKRFTWEQFYEENLGDLMLMRELPPGELQPLHQTGTYVEMTPAQRRSYDELKKDYLTTIKGKEVVAWTDGALNTKLLKLATGLEVEVEGVAESGKFEQFGRQLVSDQPPEVAFVWFRETARAAEKICSWAGLQPVMVTGDYTVRGNLARIKAFQQGEGDLLIGTIATIRESISLTRASRATFLERHYRPSMNRQAIKRLHRRGQTRPVKATHLVTADSVDEGMLSIIRKKKGQQESALRAGELARAL